MDPEQAPPIEYSVSINQEEIEEAKFKSGLGEDNLDDERFQSIEVNLRIGYSAHMEILTNASCGDTSIGGE